MEVPLQLRDLLVEIGDLNEQQRAQLPNRVRQSRIGMFNRLRQPLHMRQPPRSDDAELGKVPRSALIVCVRWRTSRSRVRNRMPRACCSRVFTATKRIVGREAASQIASASAASFFCRFTNGLTQIGGTSFTS